MKGKRDGGEGNLGGNQHGLRLEAQDCEETSQLKFMWRSGNR